MTGLTNRFTDNENVFAIKLFSRRIPKLCFDRFEQTFEIDYWNFHNMWGSIFSLDEEKYDMHILCFYDIYGGFHDRHAWKRERCRRLKGKQERCTHVRQRDPRAKAHTALPIRPVNWVISKVYKHSKVNSVKKHCDTGVWIWQSRHRDNAKWLRAKFC